MGKATNAVSIGAHVPKALLPIIDARAKARNMSRSKYVSLLVTDWHAEGCREPSIMSQLKLERLLKTGQLSPDYPEIPGVELKAAEQRPRLEPHDTDQPA